MVMEPVGHDAVLLVRVIVDTVITICPYDDLLVGGGCILVDRPGFCKQADGIEGTVELEECTLDLIRLRREGELLYH